MNTSISRNSVLFGYALAAFAASFAAACGDDEDGESPIVIGTGGSSPTGGRSSGGAPDAGGAAGSGETTGGTSPGTGGSGGAAGAGDAGSGNEGGGNEGGAGDGGAAGGAGAPDCSPQGEYGCYPCAPSTNVEYLNRCNESECAPFDNADRIPGFTGTLPDL